MAIYCVSAVALGRGRRWTVACGSAWVRRMPKGAILKDAAALLDYGFVESVIFIWMKTGRNPDSFGSRLKGGVKKRGGHVRIQENSGIWNTDGKNLSQIEKEDLFI